MRRVGGGSMTGGDESALSSDTLCLSLYDEVPRNEISVHKFENIARNRLKVLHHMERLSSVGPNGTVTAAGGIGSNDTKIILDNEAHAKAFQELKTEQLHLDYPLMDDEVDAFYQKKTQYEFNDNVSHFILRLAFCKTREAREWFIRQEQRLLALRLSLLKPEAKNKFFLETGNNYRRYNPKSAKHKDLFGGITIKELQDATPNASSMYGKKAETEWFLVPFLDVQPFLFGKHRVVMKRGFCFVPNGLLVTLLLKKFEEKLKADLQRAYENIDYVCQDKRISAFIKVLQDNGQTLFVAGSNTGANKRQNQEKLSLQNFEVLMNRSFPPCMRWAIQAQRASKRRLKHQGKLQVRPFLKDAGFELKESLMWWKQEVTLDPEIDDAKFDKGFVYDIEHTYGKKGHMKGLNTFGCTSILNYPLPSQGQVHGCPFKNMDRDTLKQAMHHWGVGKQGGKPDGAPLPPQQVTTDIEDIVKKSDGKHYQLACKEFFCKTHPGHNGDGVGNHPNAFFNESCNHHNPEKGLTTATESELKNEAVAAPDAGSGGAAVDLNGDMAAPMDVS